ncbi:MAG: hypothetical protein AB2826_26235 [Candidatus Thiodiazotropha sp.]
MPRIYMKEFSGIAVSSGTRKIPKIKREKNKTDYHPAQDYYKQIREAIITAHLKGKGIKHITQEADACPNPKKKTNFQLIAKKYKEWYGRKKATWFLPPRGTYTFSISEIILNPELGLTINDQTHVIKLYFAEESLSQNRANYMIHLMKNQLPEIHKYHVLDIRRKKLFNATGDESVFLISINSEIVGIETAWTSL